MSLRQFLSLLIACLLGGCSVARNAPLLPTTTHIPMTTVTKLPVATSTPTATPLPPTASPIPAPRLCSPLQGVPLDQVRSLISNPFHPPQPGSDDPHQGIDLAILIPGSQIAQAGNPVQAALAGRVAMVTHDRFPFGNAVIIETPLDTQPDAFWQAVSLPTPAPTLAPRSALTCPPGPSRNIPDATKRSLYVLYAHLQTPAALHPGESLVCGQVFGAVGMSGNALNPHLHFEVKVGPSDLRMDSMAHYDASATQDEMRNYCLWSVSGLFQLVDPLKLLQTASD